MIYQGDEYGDYGGHDPDSRHMFRRGDMLSAPEDALLEELRMLGRTRRRLTPLRRGVYESQGATETLLSFTRRMPTGDTVLVVINGGEQEATTQIDLTGTALVEVDALNDALGWGSTAEVGGSSVEIRVPSQSCAVFEAAPAPQPRPIPKQDVAL